ncbi:hypothetical protein GCM10011583_19480 [Streptomyces camponoticapitis]|uniref:Secreted protein n=1 Tax=Streptomyces camponoticapitis TaxID=1616125 RepID=A0ABQ2E1P9_9ACTN|nr:DUF6412 domain-containing protein [Streptomyces camponoticapitis]GGJ88123.1 hypothetical protein GCM10011583_19480 [Streptomyces camponoticapitis]
MIRRATRPLRPAPPVFFLLAALLQVLLLDAGSLSAAVALAATAAASTAFAASAVISARCAPAVPPTRVRTAIRDREQRTAFLPQRDPDARGRTRPRAPGRPVLTTA